MAFWVSSLTVICGRTSVDHGLPLRSHIRYVLRGFADCPLPSAGPVRFVDAVPHCGFYDEIQHYKKHDRAYGFQHGYVYRCACGFCL